MCSQNWKQEIGDAGPRIRIPNFIWLLYSTSIWLFLCLLIYSQTTAIVPFIKEHKNSFPAFVTKYRIAGRPP